MSLKDYLVVAKFTCQHFHHILHIKTTHISYFHCQSTIVLWMLYNPQPFLARYKYLKIDEKYFNKSDNHHAVIRQSSCSRQAIIRAVIRQSSNCQLPLIQCTAQSMGLCVFYQAFCLYGLQALSKFAIVLKLVQYELKVTPKR